MAYGTTWATAMTSWRPIGIIASVISFFGFGVFLWNQSFEDAVAPYARDLKICSALEQDSDKFWRENARDSEELSEKLQVNQDQYEKCALKAKLQWESERPSDAAATAAVECTSLSQSACLNFNRSFENANVRSVDLGVAMAGVECTARSIGPRDDCNIS